MELSELMEFIVFGKGWNKMKRVDRTVGIDEMETIKLMALV